MTLFGVLALGMLTGLHAATWGAYKDSVFEGFSPRSFARSILVGAAASVVFHLWQEARGAGSASFLVWVGVAYTLERLSTEWWKSFVRIDDQSVYTIPMRIAIGGRPIDSRPTRWLVGAGVVAGIASAGIAITLVQRSLPASPEWVVIVAVGGMGGWATAIGGAWKDAPIEGFSGLKFVRSPIVATAWAIPMSLLAVDWFTVILSAGGLSVASIETYKTFFTGGRPPGKFAAVPKLFHCPATMRSAGRLHAFVWAALSLGTLASLSAPSDVRMQVPMVVHPDLPLILLAAICAGSSLVAVLVARRAGAARAATPAREVADGHAVTRGR